MIAASIYARKSTSQDDVADEQKSVARQIDGAKAFILSKGWTLDEAHVYSDDGVSGALFANRAEFQRMMRDAEAGAFEALVLFDLDRFGRNARHTVEALNKLVDLGVAIWDYSKGSALDLDSFEGRLMTNLEAEFAQQFRDKIRKHTIVAMRAKAKQGFVTGGKVFGFDNVRIAKGQTTRVPNAAEAAVVVDIYEKFAAGMGLRTIAATLNKAHALSPRAQQGRPNGWSSSSVRAVLERPLYRGEMIYGRTASKYGRELGRESKRESGQIATPEETWTRRYVEELRIITPDLAARVDDRRAHWKQKTKASKTTGRAPQRATGKYLLSGGMLLCPACGGHFEAFVSPWTAVYVCSVRRRKPGICTNMLALPIDATGEAVLDIIEGEVLGTDYIEQLLSLVDRGEADNRASLTAERDRLRGEIGNLLDLVATGVSSETLAPKVREREAQVARLDVQLRAPHREPPNIEQLRAALEQRAEQWRAELRDEPRMARLVLRRLVGPLTLWDAKDPEAAWVDWETGATAGLLDGLAPIQEGTSPTGVVPEWTREVPGEVPAASGFGNAA